MITKGDYVLYSIEYILGAGLKDEPVYYILGVYKTKEAAMKRKRIEQKKALEAGHYHIVYYVEEIEVYKKYKNINNLKNPKKVKKDIDNTQGYKI